MKRLKFVPEVRQAHKLWSVQIGLAAAVLSGLQPALKHWEDVLPPWAYSLAVTLVIAGGVVSRLIKQENITHEELSVESTGHHHQHTSDGPNLRVEPTITPRGGEQEPRTPARSRRANPKDARRSKAGNQQSRATDEGDPT